MTGKNGYSSLGELLESSMTRHGWLGRMFGVRRWLQGGSLSSTQATAISVVAIRRHFRPDSPCKALELLQEEGMPFQGVLVDIPDEEDGIAPSETQKSGADVQLVLSTSAPWYTAFNLGAACAAGDLIVFLDGAATPQAGLLAAYGNMFHAHPETLAARGVMRVPGLDDCACQATGSFILAGETEFWPVDLDENMAVRAEFFFALGGFDESLIGGYGALDFSIRLFGRKPDFRCQRYAPQAQIALAAPGDPGLPLEDYLLQRQRAWLQLNDSLKRYLGLYGTFWREQGKEEGR